MKPYLLLLGALAMTTTLPINAAFEDYPSRSIAAVVAAFAPREDDEYLQKAGDRYFDSGIGAAKSRVLYVGKVRALPEERLNFLRQYFEGVRKRPELAALFKDEVLCREGSKEYWLPIQAPVMAYFTKEVAPGTQVDVYLALVGSFRSKAGELVHVFTINEFEVPGAQK